MKHTPSTPGGRAGLPEGLLTSSRSSNVPYSRPHHLEETDTRHINQYKYRQWRRPTTRHASTRLRTPHTWENLTEEVHFLLEVPVRELLVGRLHEVLPGVEEILQMQSKQSNRSTLQQSSEWEEPRCCCVAVTSMASKPQYSLASSSRGTSACSKRVVPHVFKMKRLLETNMLLSLRRQRDTERARHQIRAARWSNTGTALNLNRRKHLGANKLAKVTGRYWEVLTRTERYSKVL